MFGILEEEAQPTMINITRPVPVNTAAFLSTNLNIGSP